MIASHKKKTCGGGSIFMCPPKQPQKCTYLHVKFQSFRGVAPFLEPALDTPVPRALLWAIPPTCVPQNKFGLTLLMVTTNFNRPQNSLIVFIKPAFNASHCAVHTQNVHNRYLDHIGMMSGYDTRTASHIFHSDIDPGHCNHAQQVGN